ncbi:SH3-domain-containing protein [Venustampulla echinocandica]|uniref:SH3-domain-containing protein n=1 Tax=Venustampulla echinocandica TaxID=2656787 RepID=A0A370TNG5_9HELO|nr:SH3-domain-containing protein [Venustampulla echinocandica]RDL37062.1 SH3-domain-containing protein [Venustampulla echinocandica]
MGINNPLPSSMASECKKCSKILSSFVDPRQAFSPDKVIPPNILANAKGLAILTVIKAGFLGSARYGNGVVVARLADGTWSAPSAVGTGGAGFGGQIGFELTDFVFILNDASAVRTFSQAGSLTLGANVSIAAGPVGRNGEAAGAASLKGVAGIFSYSKTKGLFAGVSLEGSAIIERRDANEKLYGQRYTASQLLSGAVRPPPAAQPLMAILNSRIFAGIPANADATYNDSPVYDDRHDDVVWEGRRGSAYGEGVGRDRTGNTNSRGSDDYTYSDKPKRAATWTDDIYDRPPGGASRSSTFDAGRARSGSGFNDDYTYSDSPTSPTGRKVGPGRPAAPKPMFKSKSEMKEDEAVALFTFDADQPGDLAFKKGEYITVTKKTDSTNDWWTGRIGGRTGIFPSNYVEMRK